MEYTQDNPKHTASGDSSNGNEVPAVHHHQSQYPEPRHFLEIVHLGSMAQKVVAQKERMAREQQMQANQAQAYPLEPAEPAQGLHGDVHQTYGSPVPGNQPQGHQAQDNQAQAAGVQAPLDQAQDEPFTCDECGKRLKSATNLKRHKATVHIGTKCNREGCGMVFDNSEMLFEHLVKHHEDATVGRDNLQCSWPGCNRHLKDNAEMHRHLKEHNSNA